MISPVSIGNGGSRERNNSTEIPECVSLWTKKVIISHLHLRDMHNKCWHLFWGRDSD